jgi:opacity protein-like surface antigen
MQLSRFFISTLVVGVLLGIGKTSAADPGATANRTQPAAELIGGWTGFYLGVNGGGGFGATDADTFGLHDGNPGAPGAMGSYNLGHDLTGGLAGGQAGVNWQVNGWVWGFEADIDWANIGGRRRVSGTIVAENDGRAAFPGNFTTADQTINSFGTTRARLGFLATPALLLFGTAGLAYADVNEDGGFQFQNGRGYAVSGRAFQVGWTVGAGLEYRIAPQWSLKGEYLYYDLGGRSLVSSFGFPTPSSGFQSQFDFATRGSVARVGMNYQWERSPAVFAASLPPKAPPVAISMWEIEAGARYFYSSGRTRYTLGDPFVPGQINSQLTYKNLNSNAGEGFARIDHASGFFAKGFVGAGNIFKGAINDEDFPPAIFPYSNTVSNVNDGSLWYGTIDAGYSFWKGPAFKVGGFVGYNHFYENVNAYGCTQIAGNPFVCGPTPISGATAVLSKTENWDSLRVGLNGVFNLNQQWRVTVDGAYLPYVHLDGFDNHWLRPDINPLPQSGSGWGYQIEAILSYDVTRNFSVGVGGRYWYATTSSGTTQFPGFPASPTTFSYERYGGFLQASYKFGEPGPAVAQY